METKAPIASLHAFTETRVDLEAVGAGPVVQISLSSSRASRPHRRVVSPTAGAAAFNDEEAYSKSCLAIASSIYFSKLRAYPQSFLWRVLDNNLVLEVRSTDLCKNDNNRAEATAILQLRFPSPIRKGCVALADDGGDTLSVFALTRSNELLTLTITNKFFYNPAALDEDTEKWCHTFKPSTIHFTTPHRLIAGSPGQLVIALTDGTLLTLARRERQDAFPWQELSFHDGNWTASFRGLVKWQGNNTVRYNGTALDHNAVIALEFCPSRTHLLTVSANHTFKIWNLAKGTKVFSRDLLGQRREPQDVPRMMLDPGSPDILRVFEAEGAIAGDEFYAITYTPHDGGQFKVWAVRDADQGELGVRFLHTDDILRSPDPDSSPESKAVWRMANFKVGGGAQGSDMELWVLMRSNKRYKIYNLGFDLVDLPAAWKNGWTLTATERIGQKPPPQICSSDPQDASTIWLGYLLYPGRYTQSILETALSIYRSARKVSSVSDTKATLEDRMYSAITTQVTLQPVNNDTEAGTPFVQYHEATWQEWSLFYQEVQDLDRLSWQVLTLAVDNRSSTPCCVFAGGYAVLRGSGRLEAIARNMPTALHQSANLLEAPSIEDGSGQIPTSPYELSVLIGAAAAFRETFSAAFRYSCQAWLFSELWQEPLYSVAERIGKFYERCDFAEQVTDSAIDGLRDSLAPIGSFEALTTEHFLAIIEKLPHLMETEKSGRVSSKFGLKVLVKGAQEMIDLHAQILFDLLMVIVCVEVESLDEVKSESHLNTSVVFMILLERSKQYDLMQWLAKSVWTGHEGSRRGSAERSSPSTQAERLTVLESLFAADVRPQSLASQSQSASLTDSIQDLLVWVTGGNIPSMTLDRVVVNIQCNLLRKGELDLASDFLRFQPSTAWSMYIRGRFHLSCGESTEAALCFQKAGYKIAAKPSFLDEYRRADQEPDAEGDLVAFHYHQASAQYLASKESAHFGKGLPMYYTHILQLFQSGSYPSYAAQFAQVALQLTPVTPSERRLSLLDSLFTSSLQTSDIQTAYTTLMRLPQEKQEKLIPTLVKTFLELPGGPSQLLELPWPAHLHPAIDKYLTMEKPSSHALRLSVDTSKGGHQRRILSAWRLRHGDVRGAAAALYSQLHQQASQQPKGKQKAGTLPRFRMGSGNEGTEKSNRRVDEAYLTLINLMACIGYGTDGHEGSLQDDAWLLSTVHGDKRKVVTIEDVRKGWQKELDRKSVVEGGRWSFGMGGDEMDLG